MEPLSREAVDRLKKLGGPAFACKMIDLFLEYGAAKTGEVVVAVQSGQTEAAGKAAHALKSSAANVGAVEVERLAIEIESLAKSDSKADLAKLASELETAFETVRPLLEAVRPLRDG